MQQRSDRPNDSRRSARVRASRHRLDGVRRRSGNAAVVLTTPAAVAWAAGGVAAPVDRSAPVDLTWVVCAGHGSALVTTAVEAARVEEEYGPAAHGFDLLVVPWYEAGAFVDAACRFAGAPPGELGSDGHPAFGSDLGDELVACRLALSEPEQEELGDLGRCAARALGEALRAWRPGRSRDLDVQADIAALLEADGADAPVLIVGGDERVRRYRHPMGSGAVLRELVMAVVVARRSGLHVAVTRWAAARPLDPDDEARRRRVLAVETAVLEASVPGATYGQALEALEAAYRSAGAEGAWAEHYQGGPIGFAQREFEIAPCQRSSRWYRTEVAPGHALAWNPSLAGGAKVEDTYLVTPTSLAHLTCDPEWPTEPGPGGGILPARRPGVLALGA